VILKNEKIKVLFDLGACKHTVFGPIIHPAQCRARQVFFFFFLFFFSFCKFQPDAVIIFTSCIKLFK